MTEVKKTDNSDPLKFEPGFDNKLTDRIEHYEATSVEYIDPDTGEILKELPPDLKEELIPMILKRVKAMRRDKDHVKTWMALEVNRIKEKSIKLMNDLTAREQKDLGQVQMIMQKVGKKKLLYPGLGVASIERGRDSVDSSEFDAFELPDRETLINTYKGVKVEHKIKKTNEVQELSLFTEKITYSASKTAIGDYLKSGKKLPGFFIGNPGDSIKFKED